MSNVDSSRHRYRQFVDDYQRGQLDDKIEAAGKKSDESAPAPAAAPASPSEKTPFWAIAAASGASTSATTCGGSGRTASASPRCSCSRWSPPACR